MCVWGGGLSERTDGGTRGSPPILGQTGGQGYMHGPLSEGLVKGDGGHPTFAGKTRGSPTLSTAWGLARGHRVHVPGRPVESVTLSTGQPVLPTGGTHPMDALPWIQRQSECSGPYHYSRSD